ncbi:MAG TPA: tetratricopeptide repeat protein [Termitinemataceae bacterium]|nr:tetratricopeptide repeat protein [Treponemataceae bacterium]HOK00303.1 tetratricopeptide repeat protein [Termitinemataceae bacterium]HPQ01613.1 tetratricopeptide repeat protein [Termitinemataceae bacterium]
MCNQENYAIPIAMTMLQRFYKSLWVTLFLLIVFSCASTPPVIEEGLSPMELTQRAQEAMDRYDYTTAIRYYEVMLERFPGNQSVWCEATYGIAFIQYKQKKYDASAQRFRELLKAYEGPDGDLLPQQYRVLGEKVLGRIELQKVK